MAKLEDKFFVVGIGSSAGGLLPMRDLLHHASCHGSMSFVVVSHVPRHQDNEIASILSRSTNLVACEIEDGLRLKSCFLYTIPPDRYVSIEGGAFKLSPRPQGKPNNAADFFFSSIAKEFGKNAIGVVLSGSAIGHDGAEGVRLIKKAEGHTYAQDPETAEFPDMPVAAIETGCVDSVLTPEQIGFDLSLVSWAEN